MFTRSNLGYTIRNFNQSSDLSEDSGIWWGGYWNFFIFFSIFLCSGSGGGFSHILRKICQVAGEGCNPYTGDTWEILLANYKGRPMPFHYLYNWLLPLARFRKSRPQGKRWKKLDDGKPWLAENVAAAGRHLEIFDDVIFPTWEVAGHHGNLVQPTLKISWRSDQWLRFYSVSYIVGVRLHGNALNIDGLLQCCCPCKVNGGIMRAFFPIFRKMSDFPNFFLSNRWRFFDNSWTGL